MSTKSLFRCVWIFALFGPVFGYVTVVAVATVARAQSLTDLLGFPLAVILGSLIGLPFAWFIGTVPAILVAFVYSWLRAKLALAILPALGLSATAAVIVCAGGTAIIDGDFSTLREVEAWWTLVFPGVVATILCAGLVEHRRPD